MARPNRKKCKGCIYRRKIGAYETKTACHYMLDTGEPRECPPEKCDKRKEKKAE